MSIQGKLRSRVLDALCMMALLCVSGYIQLLTFFTFGSIVYEPTPSKVIVSLCTNGLGHVQQLVHLLKLINEDYGKLKHNSLTVFAARLDKIPIETQGLLREYGAKLIDVGDEVAYDAYEGESVNLSGISVLAEGAYRITHSAKRIVRLVGKILMKEKPAVLISFWDPTLPTICAGMGAPVEIVSIGSCGQIIADEDACTSTLDFKIMVAMNLGGRLPNSGAKKRKKLSSKLISFSLKPLEGDAIPQPVVVPKLYRSLHRKENCYFLAYSCMPALLEKTLQALSYPVILYTKNVSHWQNRLKCSHVKVRPICSREEFAEKISKSIGLITQPSRGVVTQAIACAKPVYLICPPQHPEQKYNMQYFLKNFAGVMQESDSLLEWKKTALKLDSTIKLEAQAIALRSWLDSGKEKFHDLLIKPYFMKSIEM